MKRAWSREPLGNGLLGLFLEGLIKFGRPLQVPPDPPETQASPPQLGLPPAVWGERQIPGLNHGKLRFYSWEGGCGWGHLDSGEASGTERDREGQRGAWVRSETDNI